MTDWVRMEGVQLLQCDIDEFVSTARDAALSEVELRELLDAVLSGRSEPEPGGVSGRRGRRQQGRGRALCMLLVLTCCTALAVVPMVLSERGWVARSVLGHCQDLVYPLMRQVRLWTLPVTRSLQLARFHEEECVLVNPLYRGEPCSDDCRPCDHVRTVLDLTGLRNFTTHYYHGGVPFIIRNSLYTPITYHRLQQLYTEYGAMLRDGTAYFHTNLPHVTTMEQFFRSKSVVELHRHLHVSWLPRRVSANRVLRTVVQRPYFVPANSEVSLEKFVYIDGHNASDYELPVTEFANVFLMQGSGSRTIALRPVECCVRRCQPVMVTLQARELLYYNWQFWRAVSVAPHRLHGQLKHLMPASPDDAISVTIMGSFY